MKWLAQSLFIGVINTCNPWMGDSFSPLFEDGVRTATYLSTLLTYFLKLVSIAAAVASSKWKKNIFCLLIMLCKDNGCLTLI